MNTCWSCKLSKYHDYSDIHGIRCPRCGQKEKDDPAKTVKVVVTEGPRRAPAKQTSRSK
jgi:CxxC motif-containing protein